MGEWFDAELSEVRLGSPLLPSKHSAQFVLVQGIHPARKLPPTHTRVFNSACEGVFVGGIWRFPCESDSPRLPDRPAVPFPNVGNVIIVLPPPEQSSGSRSSSLYRKVICAKETTEWFVLGTAGAVVAVGGLLVAAPIVAYATMWAGFGAVVGGSFPVIGGYRLAECLDGPEAHGVGDPHLTTFDGYRYDLQAIGEFVHVGSPGLEVQVRLQGIKGHNTRTVATAVRAGPHVVESYLPPASNERDSFSVIIDGSTKLLDFDGISFGDGTFVARRHGPGNRDDNVLIVEPAGSYVLIENRGFCQNVKVSLAHDTKTTGGLSGVPDGDKSNDFILRNGTAMSLQAANTVDGLYGRFAQSWRVRPGERLFTLDAASDFLTDEYTSLPAKMTRLSDFSEAEIEKARDECRKRGVPQGVSLDDCTYDVLATGNVEWADQAAGSAATWSLTVNTPSVTRNEVEFEAPQSVAAGSVIQFAWKGPNAPEDLIFIASPDMEPNEYMVSNSHATEKGSPAKLVAPAEAGRYEVRYFSHANGAVVSRVPLTVTAANVHLDAPQSVAAGSVIQFAWKGPNAPEDRIFIATPDMATNEFFSGHATEKGSPAKLVAPAKAGRYEVRYFSHANGAALGKQVLIVH